ARGPDRRAAAQAATPAGRATGRPSPRVTAVHAAAARPGAADRFMARALELAAPGLGRTFPNPPVGAVFVRGGRVVGEGFHTRAGAAHAEIEALRAAGRRAAGAVLYVTLEPCVHHGRTPPCIDALLPLGLERVVVAMPDPDPRVRGRGVARLRRAGVPVVVGIGRAEARRLTEGYCSRVLRGRPLVTLKLAMSLDGRIAAGGRALRRRGVEVLLERSRRGAVPFATIVRTLGRRGLTSVLVEGGATIAAEALAADVVDRLVLFIAPVLLGGDGVPAVGPLGLRRVMDAIRLGDVAVGRVGRDLVVEARVQPGA